MESQKVIAISGVKNSGKTTLLEKLIPALLKRGIRAAVVKHDGHGFEADREGTDTWRLLKAGAFGAAIFDGEKFQAVKYGSFSEEDLISLYPDADLILLEGFKWTDFPKVEIVRAANSREPVCDPASLLALVTDTEFRFPGVPTLALEDVEALADLLAEYVRNKVTTQHGYA